jgi:cytochrome c55X
MQPGTCAGLVGAAVALGVALAAEAVNDIPLSRQAELMHLLTQDCGSCHGFTLQGGLGPALTPEALAGKSPATLRAVILYGRPGTPMAPWSPFLNEVEADWLVAWLMKGAIHAR